MPNLVDWDEFLKLAIFHRVEGLTWDALSTERSTVPPAIAASLSDAAARGAAKNLATALESKKLLSAFEACEIPMLFIKGLTLGALAYRSPFAKTAVDIDLLVDPRDLREAAEVLRTLGYSCVEPRKGPLASWHARHKESVWIKSDFQVDLHTRLADSPALLPSLDVHAQHQMVAVTPAISLPTLREEELIAYLAVHGASSVWFRLKWLSDFAALLQNKKADQIDQLYDRSQKLGAARTMGQALLLAHTLFKTLHSNATLMAELRKSAATRILYQTALRLLTRCSQEPTERLGGTLPMHWTRFLMRGEPGFIAGELLGQVRKVTTLRH